MPYKSEKQRAYFHAAEKRGEIPSSVVEEWDAASKGKKLPRKLSTGFANEGTKSLNEAIENYEEKKLARNMPPGDEVYSEERYKGHVLTVLQFDNGFQAHIDGAPKGVGTKTGEAARSMGKMLIDEMIAKKK